MTQTPLTLALLTAPLMIAAPAFAQESAPAPQEVSAQALAAQDAPQASAEALTLEQAEQRLKAMGARLQAVSQELAEVSQESQVLVNAALRAVEQAKAPGAAAAPEEAEASALAVAPSAEAAAGEAGPATTFSSSSNGVHVIVTRQAGSESQTVFMTPAPPQAPKAPRGFAPMAPPMPPQPPVALEALRREEAQHRELERRAFLVEANKARAEVERERSEALILKHRRKAHRHSDTEGRVAFSGNAIIEEGEVVRELVLFSGNAEVKGEVERDVVLLAGNLFIREGAHVGGDAVVLAGNLTVEEGARIDGDTVVSAGKLNVEHGAIVKGEQVEMDLNRLHAFNAFPHKLQVRNDVDRADEEEVEVEESEGALFASLSDVLVRFLFLAASGLLLLTVLPERVRAVGRTVRGRLGASAFIGLLATFSILPLGAVLTVSLVGIPLVPVLAAGVAFSVIMGLVAVASELGRLLPIGSRLPGWLLASGALFLAVLSEVPFAGPILLVCFGLAGLGAVLLSRFGDDGADIATS